MCLCVCMCVCVCVCVSISKMSTFYDAILCVVINKINNKDKKINKIWNKKAEVSIFQRSMHRSNCDVKCLGHIFVNFEADITHHFPLKNFFSRLDLELQAKVVRTDTHTDTRTHIDIYP